MKKLVALLALTVVFISCTDSTEIPPQNEQLETQAIDKENETGPGAGGTDIPEDDEE